MGVGPGQTLTNADLLRRARWLVILAILGPLLTFAVMGLDIKLRSGHQDAQIGQWIERLDLRAPVFWPAGTVQRRPEASPAFLDMRMTPFGGFQGEPPLLHLSPQGRERLQP